MSVSHWCVSCTVVTISCTSSKLLLPMHALSILTHHGLTFICSNFHVLTANHSLHLQAVPLIRMASMLLQIVKHKGAARVRVYIVKNYCNSSYIHTARNTGSVVTLAGCLSCPKGVTC